MWNNLDKFHPAGSQRLTATDGITFSQPYGKEKMSVLQREISLLKPAAIVFVIGSGKYIDSLATAFSLDINCLRLYKPTRSSLVVDISNLLDLDGIKVLWTYHPAYLQRIKAYHHVLRDIIDTKLKL